jgi:alpha-tubulin suppressor-like RCC1 family protein
MDFRRIHAAALTLAGLLFNISTLQAGPSSSPNTVLEATGDGLVRLDVRLVPKGTKDSLNLSFKGDGGVIVGSLTLSDEVGADYEITAFNADGKATHYGKGSIPRFPAEDRPLALPLSPTGEGSGLVVSLTHERLLVDVKPGEKGDYTAHLNVYDPFGNPKELNPEDIRWGLSDARHLDMHRFDKFDLNLTPKGPFELIEFCTLEPEVFACIPNGHCRQVKVCSDPWMKVSAGGFHTCAIKQSGVAFCWGLNTQGELGVTTNVACSQNTTFDSSCSRRPMPVVCPAGAPCRFTQISSGQTFTAAIDTNGDAWWWGRGSVDHHKVNAVLNGSSVKFSSIAAGFGHACAISQLRSEIWCWGTNVFGESGVPASSQEVHYLAPARILMPFKFKKIVAGGEHTCAIGDTGTDVVCWGRDDPLVNQTSGPNSTKIGQFFFQQFGGLVQINDVAASQTSTCVTLAGTNGVRCWGDRKLASVAGFGAPEHLTVGLTQVCATTGQIANCVGNNAWGEVGNGFTTQQLVPGPVKAPPPLYMNISAGDAHTCGITPTGEIYCWGQNLWGQGGNGTSTWTVNSPTLATP